MFDIKMADLYIRIKNKYAFVEHQCRDWIVHEADEHIVPDLEVCITPAELSAESQTSSSSFSDGYCESICIYRAIAQQLYQYNAFVLHASVVSVDGAAYAFLAKSGVGKSTHTRFWLETFDDRACVVNGDKPIIRYIDGIFRAYGTPWQGKEGWGCNTSSPIVACAFLKRGQENQIQRAESEDIIRYLFHQVLLPKKQEEMESFLDQIEHFVQIVPFYILTCNMNIDAASVAFSGMNERVKDGMIDHED